MRPPPRRWFRAWLWKAGQYSGAASSKGLPLAIASAMRRSIGMRIRMGNAAFFAVGFDGVVADAVSVDHYACGNAEFMRDLGYLFQIVQAEGCWFGDQ